MQIMLGKTKIYRFELNYLESINVTPTIKEILAESRELAWSAIATYVTAFVLLPVNGIKLLSEHVITKEPKEGELSVEYALAILKIK